VKAGVLELGEGERYFLTEKFWKVIAFYVDEIMNDEQQKKDLIKKGCTDLTLISTIKALQEFLPGVDTEGDDWVKYVQMIGAYWGKHQGELQLRRYDEVQSTGGM